MTKHQENATCTTCGKPIAGRGKCKEWTHRAIGPRRVGTVWQEQLCGRPVGPRVEVVSVEPKVDNWMGWTIAERDLEGSDAGRLRNHCTAWRGPRAVVLYNVRDLQDAIDGVPA